MVFDIEDGKVDDDKVDDDKVDEWKDPGGAPQHPANGWFHRIYKDPTLTGKRLDMKGNVDDNECPYCHLRLGSNRKRLRDLRKHVMECDKFPQPYKGICAACYISPTSYHYGLSLHRITCMRCNHGN